MVIASDTGGKHELLEGPARGGPPKPRGAQYHCQYDLSLSV